MRIVSLGAVLVLVLVFSCAIESRAGDRVLPADHVGQKMENHKLVREVQYLTGRIIVSLIAKGMTYDHIRPLLWGQSSITFVPLSDGSIGIYDWYKDYDFGIYWSIDNEGVLHVDKISCYPLNSK
jgi:hypothetical protein